MVSFALIALVASTLSLAVVLDDSPKSSVVAGPGASHAPVGFEATDPSEAFEARDPRAPKPSSQPAGAVHKATFNIVEKQIEIAPGVSQLMWTYNGQVPGPSLRGKVGDRFEITLVNKGTVAHSADLHASKVAPNITMRSIDPGESLVYKFTATHSGIFMYHCGTAPVLHHLAMGMYGAVIIDPPNLPPVDHEYLFVQSELYRASDPTQPVDYAKLVAEEFDGVVFNGYFNQYTSRPIRVEPEERVRVWVMNDGPSDISSFHVIGTIFDSVYKEGAYLLQPNAESGGGQALDLAPAQGGFIEFTLPVSGVYPFITHKFADATKGAAGMFHAGDVPADAAGGHS
jgi:nitrite reductase (NO-forming)